jgi:hypothetical protein
MSHLFSMIYSLISWEIVVSQEQKKKKMHKDRDMSSGCDVEEEAKQCHL